METGSKGPEQSHHTQAKGRAWLRVKAVILRALMRIGMFLHSFPHLSPPNPSFVRSITPNTVLGKEEKINLAFFVSPDYERGKELGRLYPVVVNFHGGGFTLGCATDDYRWFRRVVQATNAVVVSVDYRLAPEYPFPTAVDDGVDALLYLESKASELSLDISKVVLTGFSSGGNLAFTVPYRLQYGRSSNLSLADLHRHRSRPYRDAPETSYFDSPPSSRGGDGHKHFSPSALNPSSLSVAELPVHSSSTDLLSNPFGTPQSQRSPASQNPSGSRPNIYPNDHNTESYLTLPSQYSPQDSNNISLKLTRSGSNNRKLRIVGIFSWYPLLDFVLPRSLRRTRCEYPKKTLAPFLTDLFDESYVPTISDRYSPFASPGRASEDFIRQTLPQEIYMYICQWDMLLHEGQEFVPKLERAGKQVRSMMIERTTHAWDKSVNPFRNKQKIDIIYTNACLEMKRLFER